MTVCDACASNCHDYCDYPLVCDCVTCVTYEEDRITMEEKLGVQC